MVPNILDEYQTFTPTTFIKGEEQIIDDAHIVAGLAAEAGEVCGAWQKYFRGDYEEEELKKRFIGEAGGLLYYLSQMANGLNVRLTDVLVHNRDALIDRQNRNAIKGDGDFR